MTYAPFGEELMENSQSCTRPGSTNWSKIAIVRTGRRRWGCEGNTLFFTLLWLLFAWTNSNSIGCWRSPACLPAVTLIAISWPRRVSWQMHQYFTETRQGRSSWWVYDRVHSGISIKDDFAVEQPRPLCNWPACSSITIAAHGKVKLVTHKRRGPKLVRHFCAPTWWSCPFLLRSNELP